MAAETVAVVWLILQVKSARCPPGTFLCGSDNIAMILQVIPVMLASIGFGFMATNWLVHAIPFARNYFDRRAIRVGDPDYRASQREVFKFSAVVAVAMLPVAILATFSEYCLTDNEIAYQAWPWTGLEHYLWSDVATIKTSCTYQTGKNRGWYGSFILILRNGARFDIMTWPRDVIPIYPRIVHALHGVDFIFDASKVSPNCAVPYDADILKRRP